MSFRYKVVFIAIFLGTWTTLHISILKDKLCIVVESRPIVTMEIT